MATFAARAAEKLRRQGLVAHLITVILGTDRYAPTAEPATHTAVLALAAATNDTSLLTQAALRGLKQLQRSGLAYQRAGILLSGLETAGQAQLGLFTDNAAQQQRSQQLMTALDAINGRFGRQLVRLAATGAVGGSAASQPQPAWAGRSAHRSPCYTTNWNDLWTVQLGI